MYMLRLLRVLAVFVAAAVVRADTTCVTEKANGCVTFSVGSGTGCQWMCNYCTEHLGTPNYYFTDGVCSYQEPYGCVGNPVAGKEYTCCAN